MAQKYGVEINPVVSNRVHIKLWGLKVASIIQDMLQERDENCNVDVTLAEDIDVTDHQIVYVENEEAQEALEQILRASSGSAMEDNDIMDILPLFFGTNNFDYCVVERSASGNDFLIEFTLSPSDYENFSKRVESEGPMVTDEILKKFPHPFLR